MSLIRRLDHVREGQVLTAIVSMCSKRILQRLRLVTNRCSNPKQDINDTLRAAIVYLQHTKKSVLGQHYELSLTFVERAKAVIHSCDAWRKHQTLLRLGELVKTIHDLNCIGDIGGMLRSIPNQSMDPSTQRSLYNIITKVARYHEISRYLYRMSKKYEAIRSMALEIVQLPESTYSRPATEYHAPTLSSTFTRLGIPHRKQKSEQIFRLLEVTEQEANAQVAAQTRKTLSEAKIHAEIQLVYHIELNPSKYPPRVIASSKDACFLCNAFIAMHRKIHMSRTHGRLYPGWRLPTVPNLVSLEKRFNAAMGMEIKASIATLHQRGGRTVYPPPNESTLSTLPHSSSTLPSTIMPRQIVEEEEVSSFLREEPKMMEKMKDVDVSSEEDATSVIVEEKGKADITPQSSSSESDATTNHLNSDHSSLLAESQGGELVPGQSLVLGCGESRHTAGALELFVEASPDLAPLGSTRLGSHSIRRLTVDEVRRITMGSSKTVVNLEALSLSEETMYEVDELGNVLVGARGEVIEISYELC
jgi:hypothetical protein